MRARVPGRSERAVETMRAVRGMVLRRRRVKARPMPRDAGVTRIQAMGFDCSTLCFWRMGKDFWGKEWERAVYFVRAERGS